MPIEAKRAVNPLELELKAVMSCWWVLGTKI